MILEALIAVALSFTLACIVHYPPLAGVIAMALGFTFVSFVLWLKSRPKVTAPEIERLSERFAKMAGEVEQLKGQVERLILRGQR